MSEENSNKLNCDYMSQPNESGNFGEDMFASPYKQNGNRAIGIRHTDTDHYNSQKENDDFFKSPKSKVKKTNEIEEDKKETQAMRQQRSRAMTSKTNYNDFSLTSKPPSGKMKESSGKSRFSKKKLKERRSSKLHQDSITVISDEQSSSEYNGEKAHKAGTYSFL